jgi:Fur family ferric uptake transcriptional regulator
MKQQRLPMKKPKSPSRTREILKSAKLYRTKCRAAVLQVLTAAERPLSQTEVAQRLGKNHLDRVTIYRTLESFIAAGLVHRVSLQERAWHYELADHCTARQCHPHFVCTDCARTYCLTQASVPLAAIITPAGFVIHRQEVRLEGLCPACGAEGKGASS